ncbi:MAG: hypothetical protein AB7I08_03275 [Thermoleophilia bacterium]
MTGDTTGERLEMLLVARWLEEGADPSGELALSVAAAAAELGLEDDRQGLLAVMTGLGDLEERGLVEVSWPQGPGGSQALVVLAAGLRADARGLFGAS